MRAATLERIFNRSVPEPNSGCWLWLGVINAGGYGYARAFGRTMLAHRAAYEAKNGPIPPGLCACHKCDVRSCVNPDHIFLGTHQDNSDDAVRKGRQRNGTRNHRATLDDAKAADIRSRYEAGETSASLASEFGLSRSGVGSVLKGRTWRHVAGAVTMVRRQPVGSRHGSAKLTEHIILEARRRHSAGERAKDLAVEFGVTRSTMFEALSGRRWRHVTGGSA